MYYVPVDAKDTVWPKSIECQIQEGDVGDFWLIDSATVIIDGKRTQPTDFTRVEKKANGEFETGKWNRVEIISYKGDITYKVNGKVVNEASNPVLQKAKLLFSPKGQISITAK